jgi:hypothetical protein
MRVRERDRNRRIERQLALEADLAARTHGLLGRGLEPDGLDRSQSGSRVAIDDNNVIAVARHLSGTGKPDAGEVYT